jgi:hypothetical protein
MSMTYTLPVREDVELKPATFKHRAHTTPSLEAPPLRGAGRAVESRAPHGLMRKLKEDTTKKSTTPSLGS